MKSVAGRQVPFTPRQFPVRLSRRVGLRHMQSIGAKRSVCPSGEQIVNGGFETGDFTPGWVMVRYCSVDDAFAHSGRYSARIRLNDGGFYQDLAKPITIECTKKFGFWFRKETESGYSLIYAVLYSETWGSGDVIVCDRMEATVEWQYYDIMPYIPPGWEIRNITIWTAGQYPYIFERVRVDDVSLIGKG